MLPPLHVLPPSLKRSGRTGADAAREQTARIAAELPRLKGHERQAFVIALELMGDPTAVPTLLRGHLWGWVDERWVRMEHQERFLVAVALDGHHKLTA